MKTDPLIGRGLRRPLAAAYLGVSPSTFDALRHRGEVPAPRRIAGVFVWDRVELDAFFDCLPRETLNDNGEDNPWDAA